MIIILTYDSKTPLLNPAVSLCAAIWNRWKILNNFSLVIFPISSSWERFTIPAPWYGQISVRGCRHWLSNGKNSQVSAFLLNFFFAITQCACPRSLSSTASRRESTSHWQMVSFVAARLSMAFWHKKKRKRTTHYHHLGFVLSEHGRFPLPHTPVCFVQRAWPNSAEMTYACLQKKKLSLYSCVYTWCCCYIFSLVWCDSCFFPSTGFRVIW